MAAPTFRNKLRVPDVLPSPDAACSDPRTLDLGRPRQRDARGCQAGVREKTGAASRCRDHVSRWAPSSERPRPSEASSSPSSPRPVSLRRSALAGRRGLWWAMAMVGDLFASFVKRRLGLISSSQAIGLDQIPESLFPLLACRLLMPITALDIATATVLFFVGELVLSRLLFK